MVCNAGIKQQAITEKHFPFIGLQTQDEIHLSVEDFRGHLHYKIRNCNNGSQVLAQDCGRLRIVLPCFSTSSASGCMKQAMMMNRFIAEGFRVAQYIPKGQRKKKRKKEKCALSRLKIDLKFYFYMFKSGGKRGCKLMKNYHQINHFPKKKWISNEVGVGCLKQRRRWQFSSYHLDVILGSFCTTSLLCLPPYLQLCHVFNQPNGCRPGVCLRSESRE